MFLGSYALSIKAGIYGFNKIAHPFSSFWSWTYKQLVFPWPEMASEDKGDTEWTTICMEFPLEGYFIMVICIRPLGSLCSLYKNTGKPFIRLNALSI